MDSRHLGHPGILGTALRLPLRLIPKGTPLPILSGPLKGKRWIFGSATLKSSLGTYELDKQIAVSRRLKRGDIFYDLGANVGFYSILASQLVGENGRVHAFEPSAKNAGQIERHLQLNNIRNCKIHCCAVSDVAGSAKFEFNEDLHTMGHLSDSAGIEVTVVTLDELVASGAAEPPNVIKCDIEGAEYKMFQGAHRVIDSARPTIFLVTHSPELRVQCQQFLLSKNYRLQSLDNAPVGQSDEIVALPD